MVDPKKLITGFLLLATLVSSFIFIFSNFSSEKTEVSDLEIAASEQKSEPKTFAGPIFENLPDPVGGIEDENPEIPPIKDPSNLTDSLAQKLVEEMALLDPTQEGLIEEKLEEVSRNPFILKEEIERGGLDKDLSDFQKEIDKISTAFKSKSNASTDDVLSYGTAISSILKENFSKFDSLDLTNENTMSPLVSSFELAVDVALIKTKDMQVPAVAANFHKSLLAFLAYQKSFIDLTNNETDPIRSALILQSQEMAYLQAAEKLDQEYGKLQKQGEALGLEKSGFSLSLVSLFSPKKAHAIFGFGDVVIDPAHIAKTVLQYAKRVATEFLKKRLVKTIVNQTINWIQGGGKPRFIQDFKGFVLGEADKAVGSEIYQHYPQLCSPISAAVKSAFYGIGTSGRNGLNATEYTRCTLSMAVENVRAAYENFGVLGWANYLESIKPQNNTFGSIMILSDIALNARSEEKAAAQTSAQSAGGLLATRKCVDVRPHSITVELGGEDVYGPAAPSANPSADAGLILKRKGETAVDSTGKEIDVSKITGDSFYGCPQSGWEVTTPGKTVGDILGKASGLHADWIVNAQDLAALATAFVDSLINKLFQAGAEGLSRAVSARSPRQSAEDMKKSCETFATGTLEYKDCIDTANEIIDIYNSTALDAPTLINIVSIYRGSFEKVRNSNNEFYDLVMKQSPPEPAPGGFVQVINGVIGSHFDPSGQSVLNCPQVNDDNREKYSQWLTETLPVLITLSKETREASTSISWLNNFEEKINNASGSIELSELTQELDGKFDAEQVAFLAETAEARLKELQKRYNEVARIWISESQIYIPNPTNLNPNRNFCDYDPTESSNPFGP